MSGDLKEMAIAGVRAILVSNPAVSRYAEDVLGILEGRKVAVDAGEPCKTELEPVIKPKEAAVILRVGVKTLERYGREGFLERVTVPGRKRGIGYTRASVERWLHSSETTKQGEAS